MNFYFDESGSFEVLNPGVHIMTGLLFPENRENELLNFYNDFILRLTAPELINGEPKGRLLSEDSRDRLFDYISANNWLRIALSLTDSEFNNSIVINAFKIDQIDNYRNNLNDIDTSLIPVMNQIIDEFTNLNEVLIVKGFLLMHTLLALLRNSVIVFEGEEYDSNWNNLPLIFDRLNRDVITRMERWVNLEFMHFIQENNQNNPIVFPVDWEIRNHPFLINNRDGNNQRLILNNIFANGFTFEDSANTPCLQIVDWISNTLYQVFQHRRPISFLERINNNLAGYGTTRINLVHFYNANIIGLRNRYQMFFH